MSSPFLLDFSWCTLFFRRIFTNYAFIKSNNIPISLDCTLCFMLIG